VKNANNPTNPYFEEKIKTEERRGKNNMDSENNYLLKIHLLK